MQDLVRRITPVGRVLIAVTVLVAVAIVVIQNLVTVGAGVLVCLCWLGVYYMTDPMHRRARGDDPAQDAVSWRDREI
jgi:hypothetical protein